MGHDFVVLASASARRSQLLAQIGVRHRSHAADVDEEPRPGEKPDDYVQRLAREKCQAVVNALRGTLDCPVLAADTTVVLDRRIFGKPADEAECVAILSALSGRRHEVLTAIALHSKNSFQSAMSRSRVAFRLIAADESRRYWATGEPAGKAGAYAIQGKGAVFVESVEGSFSGVMGLPLFETAALLAAAGVRRWQSP